MGYESELNKQWKEEELNYLNSIDTCIALLNTLKTNYITPGTSTLINTSKVSRIRLTIHDILKESTN